MNTITQPHRELPGGDTELTVPARRHKQAARSRDLIGYAFLTPWLVGFTVCSLGPVLESPYLSLTRFDLLNPAEWIGLDNYVHLFTAAPRFWKTLKVTFT
jgi:multiple sugar transport system permease protein